jgi:hypothetical protein
MNTADLGEFRASEAMMEEVNRRLAGVAENAAPGVH